MVNNPPAMQETWVQFLGQEIVPWRRKWQPTPVFLPGEFHGERSLAGYSSWDTTEQLTLSLASGTVLGTGHTAIYRFFNGTFFNLHKGGKNQRL